MLVSLRRDGPGEAQLPSAPRAWSGTWLWSRSVGVVLGRPSGRNELAQAGLVLQHFAQPIGQLWVESHGQSLSRKASDRWIINVVAAES